MGVDKLVDSTELDNNLTHIANAIRTTGGTSASLKYPEGFINAIQAIPTGIGEPIVKKQVNFIDYDGTLLYSYTAQEADVLDALPANPSHIGLTAQGWNWTLAQIKAQLTAMPNNEIWVGQMYITQSGNTEIDVSIPEGRLEPIMTIAVDGTITVDWGDNTTPDTVTETSLSSRLAIPHVYTNPGDYTIVISVTSGSFSFYATATYTILRKNTNSNENRVYANCVQNIRLGSGIISIGNSAFYNCYSLLCITIPDSVTSTGNNTFSNCYSLSSVGIPDSVSSIGEYAFYGCYSLSSITIPDSITLIDSNAFYGCQSLSSIMIPNSVTSIGNSAFYNCYSLSSIMIPNSVTSIGNSAFGSCYGMAEYHFLPTIPPTLGTTVFNSIASDCIIYVPYSADHSILEAYQTADNWSDYASYIQEEPQ